MGKPAARITDMHVCPMVTGVVPHVGGPIVLGSFTVLTGGLPQARVSDMLACVGPPDIIAMGSSGVFVNSLPAARLGDLTAHGGAIVVGLPTVLIGESVSGSISGAGGPLGAGSALAQMAAGTVQLAFADFKAQVATLLAAAKHGTPFCEVCFAMAVKKLRQNIEIEK